MIDGKKQITSQEIANKYAKYPYFILVPYKKAADLKSDYRNQIGFLMGTFESTVKYLAILLVGFYRQDSGYDNKEINKLVDKLKTPALGQYSGLLRELIGAYKNLTKIDCVKELVDVYQQEVPDECFAAMNYLADSIGKSLPSSLKKFKDLIDILVEVRNTLAHGAGGVDVKEIIPFTEAFWVVIETFLERIKIIAEYELLEVKGRTTSIEKGTIIEIRTWNGFSPSIEILAEKNLDQFDQFKEIFRLGHLYTKSPTTDSPDLFIDVSPLIMSLDCRSCNLTQIFFLNGASKKQYDFLSYQCAHTIHLDVSHPLFQNIKENLKEIKISEKEGGGGVPSWVNVQTPTTESQALYMKAQSLKIEGDFEAAIKNLQFSINLTPGYKDAVELLFSIYLNLKDHENAKKTFANYLALIPNDIAVLKKAFNLEIESGDFESANYYLMKIMDGEPDDPRGLELTSRIQSLLENQDESDKLLKGGALARKELSFQIEENEKMENYSIERPMLIYEYFVSLLNKGTAKFRIKLTKLILCILVVAMTAATAVFFHLQKDTIMALTVVSLGILWAYILKATYKIRKIIFNSQHNILAFVKGYDNNTLYTDLITPIFGKYFDPGNEPIKMFPTLKQNLKRILFIFSGGLIGIIWALKLTQYSVFNGSLATLYAVFMYLLYACLIYLISCVVMYQQLLKNLRFQNIHFSLVQHPKLSIRYLSYLSRRISYPLLGVYILFVFAVYLGPFLSNVAFVFFFSILIFFIISMYSNTILLIKHIIQKNKWKLISEFSVHFDVPFKKLIDKAKMEDMKRLQELIDIRKFIESIDEWAEKKRVLLLTSLFYLSIIVFATFGLSNIMTRIVVPKISKIATMKYDRASKIELDPNAVNNNINVYIKNVDDTIVVLWAQSETNLIQIKDTIKFGTEYLNSKSNFENSGSGYARCDWQNGKHGAMDLKIPFDNNEIHLLVIAYNKEYHSPIGLGGGKLSYDIQINFGDQEIEKDRRFLRINKKDIGYISYISLRRNMDKINATLFVGTSMLPTNLRECIKSISNGLANESDATVKF